MMIMSVTINKTSRRRLKFEAKFIFLLILQYYYKCIKVKQEKKPVFGN